MGAALGLILGAATGYAGEKYREKQQGEQLALKMYSEHPEALAMNKEAQAHLKKISPELLDVLLPVGQMRLTAQQGFQKWSTGGSPTAPTGGTPSPSTQMIAGGGVQPTSMGTAPTAAPAPNYDQQIAALEQHIKEGEKVLGAPGIDKFHVDRGNAMIQQARDEINRLTKEKEFQITKTQQAQQHAEHEQDVKEGMALREQIAASSEAQRSATAEFNRTFKTQQQELQKAKDEETRQQHLATLSKSIDTERDKILADFAKTPSKAFEARVKAYNSSASMFYRKHADAGAPTLLKYSEEPGQVYGTNPKVEAMPPQYGTNKKTGQSGWFDAEYNFYPETDETTAAK